MQTNGQCAKIRMIILCDTSCMLGHFETLLNMPGYIVIQASMLNIQQESEEESLQEIMATKEKSAPCTQVISADDLKHGGENIIRVWWCRYRYKKMADIVIVECFLCSSFKSVGQCLAWKTLESHGSFLPSHIKLWLQSMGFSWTSKRV